VFIASSKQRQERGWLVLTGVQVVRAFAVGLARKGVLVGVVIFVCSQHHMLSRKEECPDSWTGFGGVGTTSR
jgi:hypothetical protein